MRACFAWQDAENSALRFAEGAVVGSALRVSVIINNYNYGEFLSEAVESALAQTHAPIEIIAVDDGSTDGSRRILSSYEQRIKALFKTNGGQASAFNAGWSASSGDILCFLDADDWWMPDKVARTAEIVSKLGADCPLMLCHRLSRFDASGIGEPMPDHFWGLSGDARTGDLEQLCSPEDAYGFALEHRDLPFIGSPTSGISLTRSLAERVFPLPEVHAMGADALLVRGSAITGTVFGACDVLGVRRFHGANLSVPEKKHLRDRGFLDAMRDYLNRLLVERGLEPVLDF